MYLRPGQSEKGREREQQKVSMYIVCKPDIPYSITQDVLQVFNIRSLLYAVLHITQAPPPKWWYTFCNGGIKNILSLSSMACG